MLGKSLHHALMLFALASQSFDYERQRPNTYNSFQFEKDAKKQAVVIPKGCKEYYFNIRGEFETLKSETVFICVASNDKNAIRKFQKWKQTQNL